MLTKEQQKIELKKSWGCPPHYKLIPFLVWRMYQ